MLISHPEVNVPFPLRVLDVVCSFKFAFDLVLSDVQTLAVNCTWPINNSFNRLGGAT